LYLSANESPLQILFNDSEPEALENAWAQKATFAYASKRSGVSADWIKTQLAQLPKAYHEDRFVLLTSGSTGEPKLIIGHKKRSEKLAQVLHEAQESEPVKETLVLLPLTYTFAFVNQWIWAKVFHRAITITEGLSNPKALAESLEKSSNSMVCMVGAQIPMFRQYFQSHRFDQVIRLHFAGGPFPQNDLEFINRLFPNARIFNNYGCAEAMPRLTLRKAENAQEAHNVGKALPGVQLRISDDGNVEFQSPYRAEGQIANGAFEAFAEDQWLASGDKGELDNEGHLRLHGRANQVFKRYGEKISLPQLLRTVKEVWDGQAVFYKEEDAKGEQGHILLLSPTPEKSLITSILRGFRASYPRTHWPLRIESTPSIPLLNNGKEDLRAAAELENTTTHWAQRI
jgi:long-subunit acyl-CoA synthetase (AMP-forming)